MPAAWKSGDAVASWAFALGALLLLVLASLATNKGDYKRPDAQEVGALLFSVFAISLLVERTVAVLFAIFRQQGEHAAREWAQLEIADVPSDYEPPGDPEERKKVDSQAAVAERAAAEFFSYRDQTSRYALMVGSAVGLLLALSGVSTLRSFVSEPGYGPEIYLYRAMDGLLSGGAIGGGSAGVRAIAVAIMSFFTLLEQKAARATGTHVSPRRPAARGRRTVTSRTSSMPPTKGAAP